MTAESIVKELATWAKCWNGDGSLAGGHVNRELQNICNDAIRLTGDNDTFLLDASEPRDCGAEWP